MNRYIVFIRDGIHSRAYGPFDTYNEAKDWAEINYKWTVYFIVTMEPVGVESETK